mgnify:CR=1 FL=1
MIGGLLKKIFGTKNDREVKALTKIVDQINALEPEYEKLSDEDLRHKTDIFKERLENGELKYAESHILCNLFNIEAIEKIAKMNLPYHVAFKKAKYLDENGNLVVSDKPNAYKFESFIFDAFEKLDDLVVLRVKRENEFAPVKNAEGEDSPETARKLYIEFHNK